MEKSFYKDILSKHEISTIIPEEGDREFINHSIFHEFSKDVFSSETKKRYIKIIKKLEEDGAQGIILGCTEIPLLIKQTDINVKAYDTTLIHVRATVEFANT
jgi:aspartate racemase